MYSDTSVITGDIRTSQSQLLTKLSHSVVIMVINWLPTLERVSVWYKWEEEEQLAGHLWGKAQRECDIELISKKSYENLQSKCKFGEKLKLDGKVIVAQDFHHTSQGAKEIVSRIISRLENLLQGI